MRIRIAGGRLKTVDFTLAPLIDAEGRVAHILATGTEISTRRSLEIERALAQERAERERAEAGLHARDEVIAIIAHELRAPLNSIIGWNRMLARMNIGFAFRVPDKRFNRRIGVYKDDHFAPDGAPVSAERFAQGLAEWLPSDAERAHVKSLMRPVYEPGKIAGWIAPPARGIDGKPALDFEYVRL